MRKTEIFLLKFYITKKKREHTHIANLFCYITKKEEHTNIANLSLLYNKKRKRTNIANLFLLYNKQGLLCSYVFCYITKKFAMLVGLFFVI